MTAKLRDKQMDLQQNYHLTGNGKWGIVGNNHRAKGSEEKSRQRGTPQRARLVEKGAEDFAEHGLGAAHRLRVLPHRPRRERPLQRQGMLVPAKAFAARHRRTKVVPRCFYCVVLDDESSGTAFFVA